MLSTLDLLTSELIVSCPVDHLCQKSVNSFSKYRVHKFGDEQTDERTHGEKHFPTDGGIKCGVNFNNLHIMHPFGPLSTPCIMPCSLASTYRFIFIFIHIFTTFYYHINSCVLMRSVIIVIKNVCMYVFKRVVCVHPRLARIGFFTGMPRDCPLSVCLSVCLSVSCGFV